MNAIKHWDRQLKSPNLEGNGGSIMIGTIIETKIGYGIEVIWDCEFDGTTHHDIYLITASNGRWDVGKEVRFGNGIWVGVGCQIGTESHPNESISWNETKKRTFKRTKHLRG